MKKVDKKKKEYKEIEFLKKLFGDFKKVMTEAFGETSEFISKHKFLLLLAFIAFLIYKNRQFSIQSFVDKLEERFNKEKDELFS